MRLLERTPPTFFAIPFGLAGLASVWRLMNRFYGTPGAISDAVFVVAATVWFLLAVAGLGKWIRAPRSLLAELRDPVLSQFWSLPCATRAGGTASMLPVTALNIRSRTPTSPITARSRRSTATRS
jgi:tellurite resistance protein